MKPSYAPRKKNEQSSNSHRLEKPPRNKFGQGNRRFSSRGKGRKVSVLDPSVFIKKAIPFEQTIYKASRLIKDLPINDVLKRNLIKKGYETPTEIQDKTLDALLEGNNLLGLAQTGTGKTSAFLTPITHHLISQKPTFQVLIVAPTRELAMQVHKEFRSITKDLSLYSSCFIGGTSVGKDIASLRRPSHVVIGTPGRLMDLNRQKALDFRCCTTLVLDEFDRLCDMGFSDDIKKMVNSMPNRKQTVLFSATEIKKQRAFIQQFVKDPVEVRVTSGNATGNNIEQDIVKIGRGEKKIDVLINMVQDEAFQKVLVFAETKRMVTLVCKNLNRANIKADEIHGDKSQGYRMNALRAFRTDRIQVLVATDVAARGLDISGVTQVINYQKPADLDSYIHRVGRTGRAGKSGQAFTFIETS